MASGFRLSAPNEYRRGVVLGLTLAEVLILLVFLLLLTMTALLMRKDRENAALRRNMERDANIVAVVQGVAARQGAAVDDDRLAILIRDGAQADRLRSELREARQQAEANARAAKEDQALANLLEQVSGQPGEATPEKLSRVIEQAEANAQAASSGEKLTALLKRVPGSPSDTPAQKLETVVGQNIQMRDELARLHGNNGSGLPYCWPLPGASGQPEYMLLVDLHDDGIVVSDLAPRPRPGDPAWGVLDTIARGQLMPMQGFLRGVAPLKSMEGEQRCRYAIQVLDSTARTNKPGYKLFMGQLWSVFQLKEIRR